MPLLTPSRLLTAVVFLSFFGLLWNLGSSSRRYPPQLPVAAPQAPPVTLPQRPILPPHSKADTLQETQEGEEDNGDEEDSKRRGSTAASTLCQEVRGAHDTMIIIKTSKADTSSHLPPHLAALLACAPHAAIFSDHAGTIDGHEIHDALDAINATLREKYDEFREHAKMQTNGGYTPSANRAQQLDKWKFLPMVYRAYRMQPSHRYYLFIEPTTSLSWTNLLQWLDRLDYRIPYYSGAPIFRGQTKFAQQSAGILLSLGAMRLYAKAYDERYASEWEPHVGSECCGDVVLRGALAASRVELTPSFPLLQGEALGTLDWTERHWCTPIVSWHGGSEEEMGMLWDSQRKWTEKYGWEKPYLARDAFEEFVMPQLGGRRVEWDNVSSDTKVKGEPGRKEKLAKEKAAQKEAAQKEAVGDKPQTVPRNSSNSSPESAAQETLAKRKPPAQLSESGISSPGNTPTSQRLRPRSDVDISSITIKDAADSAENCGAVCQKTSDCIQWKYSSAGDGECHLGKVLRLGRKVETEDEKRVWTSGWILDRIKEVTEKWGRCEKPNWKFYQ